MQTVNGRPEEDTKSPPPYFAFRTLTNTLEDMKKRGIPNRIDRSFLPGMSGAGQTQFIAGLKSLGLIDAGGTVQPVLRDMVNATPEERGRLLGEVLKDRFPEAVALGSTNATTGELVEVFREYGVAGDTARKAIAFYLQAAKFAGNVPLSPLFQTPRITSSGGTKRRRPRVTDGELDGETPTPQTTPTAIGMTDLHPALAGVLIELPRQGRGWTKDRRDAFLKMFEMAVDFTIPIVEDADEETNDDFEEEADDTLTA